MTQVAASPTGISSLERDAEAERLNGEALPSELTADEWLAPFELEHFAIEHFVIEPFVVEPNTPTPRDDTSTSKDGKNERSTIDPRALADAYPPLSFERDFWEDVAVLSEQAALSPHNVAGTPYDNVTHAIAVVAAHYSLPADKRVSPSGGPSPGATQGRAEHGASPVKTSGSDSSATELDFFDVVAELVGLEDVLGLPETRDVDGTAFVQSRELAAMALVAHDTNRNSALKAAEGRRG